MRHLLIALYICLPVSLPLQSSWAAQFPDEWDRDFAAATGRYLPGLDWRLLKAQGYQESLLKPDAVSPVGAMGLMQFMPGTWRQVMGDNVSPWVPELSIEAAAIYMSRLRRQWSAPRPEWDRHSLALASYNAGLGHLLTAQKQCGGVAAYDGIIACLPDVTGRHSEETITYVARIWKWFRQMTLWG